MLLHNTCPFLIALAPTEPPKSVTAAETSRLHFSIPRGPVTSCQYLAEIRILFFNPVSDHNSKESSERVVFTGTESHGFQFTRKSLILIGPSSCQNPDERKND